MKIILVIEYDPKTQSLVQDIHELKRKYHICDIDLVSRNVKITKKELSIEFITKTVCSYYNTSLTDLENNSARRKREDVKVRQVAMYFSKYMTKKSLANIGNAIAGKDHATVLHACKTVNNLYDTDREFRREIEEIERNIKRAI